MKYDKKKEPNSAWREKLSDWSWKVRQPILFWWQRQTQGFDESDVWSLDYTICRFAIPRLKVLKEMAHGYPTDFLHPGGGTFKEMDAFDKLPEEEQERLSNEAFDSWKATIDKMIRAMELFVNEGPSIEESDSPKYREWKEGMDLFFKYFFALWD